MTAAPALADEVAQFVAASNQAMEEILQARKAAGIGPGDALDPLVQAVARTVGVLGRLPAVLATRQKDAEVEAVGSMSMALQQSLAELVNRSGADLARKAKLQWLCISAGVLAAICGAVWWWAASSAFGAGVASEHWRAEAAITEARRALPANMRWAAAITDEDAQARAIWAAKTPAANIFSRLSDQQVRSLAAIAQEADAWAAI